MLLYKMASTRHFSWFSLIGNHVYLYCIGTCDCINFYKSIHTLRLAKLDYNHKVIKYIFIYTYVY